MAKCFVCKKESRSVEQNQERDIILVDCPRCGRYAVTGTASLMLERLESAHIVSGYLRERSYLNLPMIELDSTNLAQSPWFSQAPTNLRDRLDKIVFFLGRTADYVGEMQQLTYGEDYPISYSRDHQELMGLMDMLEQNGELEVPTKTSGSYRVRLSEGGWRRYEELQQNPPKVDQAFVAMWFDDSMKHAYEQGIKRAIADSDITPKINPLKIDLLEHNDPIDSRILVEIRKSRFMIADFTGHRGGVYFEAGYALALKIPVIWTCKREEADKMHFDIRQFSHIEWGTPEDLYEKLKRRIEGSIF